MRRTAIGVMLAVFAVLGSACSWVDDTFGGDDQVGEDISAFDAQPGQCFNPPEVPKAELVDLRALPCDTPHSQEAYARVDYTAADGSAVTDFPGNDAIKAFAEKECQRSYETYVGVIYQNSALFISYLLPSARGWEQGGDRTVICFVVTTGKPLTATVKDTKV